ncbi:ferric reductase-like transmembrane domain-containing protein [Amphritea pacifica]|uniref:ferredoxin reductase family protein n=1 Tax=Amphritea pacifica TaxID=2811233 RepID=UPI001965CE8D|nr:ferric reductase-like transmembrane domain-containing protein [Amphritea pacifica]MBN1006740.1 ferric reductase-like transmembrane domain-containing protein [Amphritea pacifica]
MKPIKTLFALLLVLLTGVWLFADTLIPEPFSYFAFRAVFIQYTGVIAIGVMSMAMLLALRLKWLERYLDGLDKSYRLHKWLGITALVTSVVHWWMAQGSKWMVGWGWLEKPVRGPRPEETLGFIEGLLRSQRGFAESVGEWAFYAAAVLMVLALIKRFPYHLFVNTHQLISIAYLVLAYHSVVLLKFEYWLQPVGILMAAMLAGGSVAAVLALTGRIGKGRKVQGRIDHLSHYDGLRVLESEVVLDEGWQGHAAGQFAFVTSNPQEGAHPYTIASAWNPADPRIVFITKALGDHTGRLRDQLKTGMPVTVEGPYGCFDFTDAPPRQIWIGAGIGITPFIARMKELAKIPGDKPIDLFHPTADFDQNAIDKLTADAAAAGVTLHLLVSGKEGRLDCNRICSTIPQWSAASVWFCGPAAFGQSLRKAFIAKGMAARHFHQELFQMR